MNLLKNFSIKAKLIIFFLLIAVLTLFLCAFLFIASDIKMLKESTVRNLTVLAKTVGDNCVASLLFDDRESAKKILSSLKREYQIQYGVLYNEAGDVFAVYKKSDNTEIHPSRLQGEGHLLDTNKGHKGDLEIVRHISFENEIIGSIHLHIYMSELQAQVRKYVLFASMLLLLTLSISFAVALWLQKIISQPILLLDKKAKIISEEGKYDVTVQYEGKDELGTLYASFNKMISRIRQREQDLVDIRDHLEQLVIERTKELNEAKDAAETATLAKSTFLAHMSHELRTPLNAIIGLTDLAVRNKNKKEREEYMKLVSSSVKFLRELVNNILDLSKIETGKLDIEDIPFDLCKTIREAVAPIAFQAHQKKLEFHLFLDPAIPQTVYGDTVRLRQIIMNFADNAVKFTDKGGVDINVKVEEATEKKARIHFSIIDTGMGIPEEQLEKMFESFTQVDASITRKYGGSGLGTTISRELVYLMKGSIRMESTLGKGTCVHFVISLNICEKELVEFISDQQSHATEYLIGRKKGALNILVVEDNLLNRKLAVDILKILDHKVLTAENGKIGLEMWKKGNYDLILMDIMMPEMDGFQTTRAIREMEKNRKKQEKNIIIIALTANASKEIIEKCFEAGMDNFILKPMDFDELEKKIGWASFEDVKNMEDDRKRNRPDGEQGYNPLAPLRLCHNYKDKNKKT